MKLFLVLLLLIPSISYSFNERHYQELWCTNGELEYRLADGARVDCLTEEYAIEVDFAKKWAEAIGQSLYYSSMTHRKAGVLLITDTNEFRFLNRILAVATDHGIRVWLIEK